MTSEQSTDRELMQQTLDAFNKMTGRKPEFVEQVISALQNRLAQPEQKPLTNEEMYALAKQVGFDSELMRSNHDRGTPSLAEKFARAIEAKHGIVA